MPVPPKRPTLPQPPRRDPLIEHEKRQNAKRFQEIEQYLVLLLDTAEHLNGIDDTRKRHIREAKEHLQKRTHRPHPPE